jgi:hypothetical protein
MWKPWQLHAAAILKSMQPHSPHLAPGSAAAAECETQPLGSRIFYAAQSQEHRNNRADPLASIPVAQVTLVFPNYHRIGFLTRHPL